MLKNLRKIRIKKDLSLQKLSNMTGISTTYLNDLENLNRKNPSYKVMNKLIKALRVTVEEIEGNK